MTPAASDDRQSSTVASAATAVAGGGTGLGLVQLLSPLILPIVFVLGTWFLYDTLALNYAGNANLRIPPAAALPVKPTIVDLVQLPAPQREADSALVAAVASRLAGRLTWVTFLCVSLMVAVVGLFVCAYIVRPLWLQERRCGLLRRRTALILLSAALIAAWVTVVFWIDYTRLYSAILRPTLQVADFPDIGAWQLYSDRAGLMLGIGFGALASLILPSPVCADPRCLRERASYLQLVLAVTTALLVADVVRTDALLRWASAFIDPRAKATSDTVRGLAFTIVSVRGLYATTLLSTIYLPAAFLLRERVRDAAAAAIGSSGTDDIESWLRTHGLSTQSTLLTQVRPILALLLPLLAGLVSGPGIELVKTLAAH